MKSLQGRVALITGGASGIGKAAALQLAREGASVAILGRTRSELSATAKEIGEVGLVYIDGAQSLFQG